MRQEDERKSKGKWQMAKMKEEPFWLRVTDLSLTSFVKVRKDHDATFLPFAICLLPFAF